MRRPCLGSLAWYAAERRTPATEEDAVPVMTAAVVVPLRPQGPHPQAGGRPHTNSPQSGLAGPPNGPERLSPTTGPTPQNAPRKHVLTALNRPDHWHSGPIAATMDLILRLATEIQCQNGHAMFAWHVLTLSPHTKYGQTNIYHAQRIKWGPAHMHICTYICTHA